MPHRKGKGHQHLLNPASSIVSDSHTTGVFISEDLILGGGCAALVGTTTQNNQALNQFICKSKNQHLAVVPASLNNDHATFSPSIVISLWHTSCYSPSLHCHPSWLKPDFISPVCSTGGGSHASSSSRHFKNSCSGLGTM